MLKGLFNIKQSNKRLISIFPKIILILMLLSSCRLIQKTLQTTHIKKISKEITKLPKSFVGFSVYDLEEKKYLIQINDEYYFTPASNTKILTLATYLDLNLSEYTLLSI